MVSIFWGVVGWGGGGGGGNRDEGEGAPLTQTPASFGPESCFSKLLLKLKLCTKVKVVRFNGYRNN